MGLEDALLLAGGERFDRAAEQDVDLRISFLGEQSRQRFTGGKADEIDVDAGCLLERLQHRARVILRPDRIGLQGFRGAQLAGDKRRCQCAKDQTAAI